MELRTLDNRKIGEIGIKIIIQDLNIKDSASMTVHNTSLGSVFDEIYFHLKHIEMIEKEKLKILGSVLEGK